MIDNYPPGMDWGAYDDYHTPMLECGHRSDDDCDCWCDGGSNESSHMEGHCTGDNCTYLQCQSCGGPTDEKEWTVANLQRMNVEGKLLWVDKENTKPLRFIPQHKLLMMRLCENCFDEYESEITELKLHRFDKDDKCIDCGSPDTGGSTLCDNCFDDREEMD
jgi:hypothetical protein